MFFIYCLLLSYCYLLSSKQDMCNWNISTVPLCDICAEYMQHSCTLDVCCTRAVSIDASQLHAASMHITGCSMLVLYAVCTHPAHMLKY